MKNTLTKEEIFNKYLENAEAYVDWTKLRNGQDPDEEFMRSVEEMIDVSESVKKHFREDIIIQLSRHLRKGWRFSWESNERLKRAILSLVEGGETK